MNGLDAAFARLLAVAASTGLPGIEPGTSYGTPALKAAGKLLARVKDADTLVFVCAQAEKAFLLQAAPAVFYETDHYRGYDAVLLRLATADDATIAGRLAAAFRLEAAKRPKRTKRAAPGSGG